LDRPQFEQLALEQMDAVYRMALQLAKHPDEASDLVQETYLKALRSSEGFVERGGGIRSWLFTILHNTFYSRVKREARGPTSGSPARISPPPRGISGRSTGTMSMNA